MGYQRRVHGDRDSRQTTVEAVVQTRKPTGTNTYFAKSNAAEAGQNDYNSNQREEWEDPRFEDNHICLKLHLKCSINRNAGVLLAGVEAPSPLLPLPPAAGGHTQEAAEPGSRRRRRLEESGVETKQNPITIYSLVGTLRHYGRVIWQ